MKLGKPPCNLTKSSSDLICVERIMYELDNGLRNCSCGPTCNEIDYEVSLSQSEWPSKQYTVQEKKNPFFPIFFFIFFFREINSKMPL